MLAPNPRQTAEQQRAARHRANVAECKPFLTKDIPLGLPTMENTAAITRYYGAKHRRGEFGKYWPLHQVAEGGYGTVRSLRRRS